MKYGIRPSILRIFIITVLLSIFTALFAVFIQDIQRYSLRLERIRAQSDALRQLLQNSQERISTDEYIREGLSEKFIMENSISAQGFSRELERIFSSWNLAVISFRPSTNEYSQILHNSFMTIRKSDSTQIQFRSQLAEFLNVLRVLERQYPWMHIERLNYRVLSSENRYPIQCDLLISFHELSFTNEEIQHQYHTSIRSDDDKAVQTDHQETRDHQETANADFSERTFTSFYIPGRPAAAAGRKRWDGSPAPAPDSEWQYLGELNYGGQYQISLKYLPSSAVFVLGIGDSWQDWELFAVNQSVISMKKGGYIYYVERRN